MKKSFYLLLLSVLTVFIFTACNQKTKYEVKIVESIASIEIPTYMSYQDTENPEASLEQGNIFKEHYLMLLIESREEISNLGYEFEFTIESYADLILENFDSSLENSELKKLSKMPKMINGMKSLQYEIHGGFPGIEQRIYYFITILESDTNFYSIFSWCLINDEQKFKSEMKHIAKSLKEI